MSTSSAAVPAPAPPEAVRTWSESPAGPAPDDGAPFAIPPGLEGNKALNALQFGTRPLKFMFRAREECGENFRLHLPIRNERFVVTSHPDHVRSLFTAKPDLAPTMTGESPLRPILGPNSVLTSLGDRHMRQRKLLLPPFHGDAVRRYAEMIGEVVDAEIDRWPIGKAFALRPAMQAITLDVIMSAIFGIEGRPAARHARGEAALDRAPLPHLVGQPGLGRGGALQHRPHRAARPDARRRELAGPRLLRGDPQAPRGARARAGRRRALAADGRARRGRPADDRLRSSRRADGAGAGRP